jgi:NAD(P)H-nitrite reductase large subunit
MLIDGQDGAVLQRDGRTYAITPHLPCGLVSPEMLRTIADVAERFGAVLKCTGTQRIAIIGLREEDVDPAWAALGRPAHGHMTGNCVRSVRACPGTQFCKRARQDSLAVGLELDRRYLGRRLPGKMKLGVSGCPNQCAESSIKDIGLVGGSRGWTIVVGGSGGMSPRLAKQLTDQEISTEQALEVVDRLIKLFEEQGRQDERFGDLLARLGLKTVREYVGLG